MLQLWKLNPTDLLMLSASMLAEGQVFIGIIGGYYLLFSSVNISYSVPFLQCQGAQFTFYPLAIVAIVLTYSKDGI